MAKCPPCDCKGGLPLWLGTFGDLMSLLLTFFILLLSMATFVHEKVDLALGSLKGSFGVLNKGSLTEIRPPKRIKATDIPIDVPTINAMNVLSSLTAEYNELNSVANSPTIIKLEESENGFIIRIPNLILFSPGKAEVVEGNGKDFIARIGKAISQLPAGYEVKAIGNTDNQVDVVNDQIIDSWQLSSYRGMNVAKEMLKAGVAPSMISAGGNSEYDPVALNDTEENRALNRRVDIHIQHVGQKTADNTQNALGQVMGVK